MNRQRGLALSALLLWAFVIVFVAILGMRVAPAVSEYYTISKNVKAVAAASHGASVADLRNAFARYAAVDRIESITPADLEISRTGREVLIGFSYEKRIPLFWNVSLLINFQGSSTGHEKG